MSNPLFPIQDSTLSADALADWLGNTYVLASSIICLFHRKGICDTYRVEAGAKRFYLKIYRHRRRSQIDVAEEVRLLLHLSFCGVPVARPVGRQDGEFVSRLYAPEGVRFAVLYEAALGQPDDEGDIGRIRAFGEAVGQLHECADQMDGPYRRAHLDMEHLLGENLAVIGPFMAQRPEDFQLIRRIAQVCETRITALLPHTEPEFGICHGDLHGGDVCYGDDGLPVLFDFDSSGCGWRALDIGVFLASDSWMDTSDEAETRRQAKLGAFLRGYETRRVLSVAEREAIQLTPAVRHIFLMGHVLRYTTQTQGDHWADDRFIDWHMTWYRDWANRHL